MSQNRLIPGNGRKSCTKNICNREVFVSLWNKISENITFGEKRENGLERNEKRKMNQLCRISTDIQRQMVKTE